MAAGLGFKDFVTGEVLTAADVDGYLMQGVWVFASAAARDAAVTSPQEGNFAYLKDTNVTTYYTGSAWANLDTTGMTNPMTTTGDTIYSSSGSTPARLGIGTTGQVLTVAGGIPSWATAASGGGMTSLATGTLSGASLDLTSISQSYVHLQLVISDWNFANANNQFYFRINNLSQNYYFMAGMEGSNGGSTTTVAFTNKGIDSLIYLTGGAVDSGDDNNLTIVNIYNYTASSIFPFGDISSRYTANGGGDRLFTSQWTYDQANAVSQINLFTDSGNWNGGTYTLYGVK